MPTSAKLEKASERVVVLLQPTEKRRLEKLAKAQHVSSAEILRRSLHAYESQSVTSEQAVIAEMNATLDKMLESIKTTRQHVRQTLTAIRSQKRVNL